MFSKNTVVGVIGAGAMGSGIAQVAASAGHQVIVYDSSAEALNKARAALSSTLDKLVEKQKISREEADALITRIAYEKELHSFRNCGLVIEAIVENLEVKQKVFSLLESIVKADCVLATNTSSFSIASIASASQTPSRIIGIHFFNPAPLMPLVEIIPGILTDNEVTRKCRELIASWGKTVVTAKDTPGFIVNRVARSFYGESIRIYEEGIADIPTIDWALKTFGGFKMGPFELMDFIGNDVNYKVTESVWEQFFYEPRFKPSLTQKRLFEARLFGRKSGRGYYTYGANAPQPTPVLDTELGKAIFNRVLVMLVNEAVDTLYLQVASREDIELAMTKGVNYPKGLLAWGEEVGMDKVLSQLTALYNDYQEDRYRPSLLLKKWSVRKQKTTS
jgi:3-hydroxybutyryl-CoA dehydrogenase